MNHQEIVVYNKNLDLIFIAILEQDESGRPINLYLDNGNMVFKLNGPAQYKIEDYVSLGEL